MAYCSSSPSFTNPSTFWAIIGHAEQVVGRVGGDGCGDDVFRLCVHCSKAFLRVQRLLSAGLAAEHAK